MIGATRAFTPSSDSGSSAPYVPTPDVHPAASRRWLTAFAHRAIRGRFRLITLRLLRLSIWLAVSFSHAEEAAAAHRGFKRTGDFYYLIVVQISGYTLAFGNSSQLFDVVVRIAFYGSVSRIANTTREHAVLRFYRGRQYGYGDRSLESDLKLVLRPNQS